LKKRIADRLAEYSAEGWDIGFALQPANLPDLNTLDLGFFRAIQSLQYQKPAKNLDEMIDRVLRAAAHLPLSYRVAVHCPIVSPSSIANASPPSCTTQATIKMPQWPSSASSKRAPPTMS